MVKKGSIFDSVNEIKEITAAFISKLVEYYGSPDNYDNVYIDVTDEIIIHSFTEHVKVERIINVCNYEDSSTDSSIKNKPELQIIGLDIDRECQIYTYKVLPVEGLLELAYKLADSYGLSELFDNLFSTEE